MKKEIKDNLQRLANRIWTKGELLYGAGCLVPKWADGKDDPIIKEYNVTHYDRKWEVKGKSVIINLYKAEAFGAAEPEKDPIKTFVVEV